MVPGSGPGSLSAPLTLSFLAGSLFFLTFLFFPFPPMFWESPRGWPWAGTVLAGDWSSEALLLWASLQPGFLKEIYRCVKDPRPSLEVVREPWQQQRALPG